MDFLLQHINKTHLPPYNDNGPQCLVAQGSYEQHIYT